MASKLHIAEGFSLPVDAVTQRITVLGKTRSGKSHTAQVIVEEVIGRDLQSVVLDPKGDWYGLRSSSDGRGPGLPITILGGRHGDAPLEPHGGRIVADMVTEEGISFILDFSLFESREDEVLFATEFADRLYRKNTDPVLVVLDEADTLVPQDPENKAEMVMRRKYECIARRGMGRGIGLLMCSQRCAAIHKGALSQTELMIAHQTNSPQDRESVEDWMKGKGTLEQQREFMKRLTTLKQGEAIIWSPSWLEIFQEIKIRPKKTYDSSATPRVGRRRRAPKVLASIDLERLKLHMAQTIERARADDPAALRERIAGLERDLHVAKRAMAPVPAPVPRLRAAPPPPSAVVRVLRTNVPLLKEGDQKRVEQAIARLERAGVALKAVGEAVTRSGAALGASLTRAVQTAKRAGEAPVAPPAGRGPPVPVPRHGNGTPSPHDPSAEVTLLAGERKMLNVLVRFHPGSRTLSQLGLLSGFTPRGGTFKTYLRKLTRAGYVWMNHDGSMRATGPGIAYFGDDPPQAPENPEELFRFWCGKLLAGERKMLDILVRAFPDPLTEEVLGSESGFTHTGGTFKTYLRTLKRNELAVADGDELRAARQLVETA